MPITRRAMLGLLSGSTFFLTAGGRLAAAPAANAPGLSFSQGVASGDPRADAVMLWTRALPEQPAESGSVPVVLQLSRAGDFSAPLLQVQLATGPDSDYTVRAYVDGLEPDSTYYYRFLGGSGTRSRTGRTRTAPPPGAERDVRLAFVSCQNFEDGFYASWARMLADDEAAAETDQIQFVLHLGDFIYERCWHERSGGGTLSRQVPPFPDGVVTESNRYAVSLEDYRHLYKTYLADPNLQAARARWPFICTWDDHEFANDSYQSYSTYGAAPQLQAARKQHANRAWFEYIPAVLDELPDQPAHGFRPGALSGIEAHDNSVARDSLRIYRQLRWGQNLDLLLTDSRSYRSPPCLAPQLAAELGLPLNTVELVAIADGGRAYADGNPPATLPYGDGTTPNPAREREPGSMLGLAQRDWLLDALSSSPARWKVWGNALPLLPLRLDMSSLPFAGYQDSIFNIDSWSGYPHESAYLMRELARRGVGGVVSLSGDHHMHGAGTIAGAAEAAPVIAEFNVAGISSSPLFEELAFVARRDHPEFQPIVYDERDGEIIPVWNMTMLDGVFASLSYSKTGLTSLARWLGPNRANPGLSYVDTTANGYGLARFTATGAEVDLVTMSDCRAPFSEPPAIAHIARFELSPWQGGQAPAVEGPSFRLGAPFPFAAPTV
jgi:alkaline phosphatase D